MTVLGSKIGEMIIELYNCEWTFFFFFQMYTFGFFSVIGYGKILNIVSCTIQ